MRITIMKQSSMEMTSPSVDGLSEIYSRKSPLTGPLLQAQCGLSTAPTAQAMPQMLFLRAATQNALTTVEAGFAFTIITLPKTSLLPALVAGFLRVFNMHRPGMVNLPFFFTSLVANSARLSSAFLHTAGFNSVASASAAAMPDLLMDTTPFIAAALARGAMWSRSTVCAE